MKLPLVTRRTLESERKMRDHYRQLVEDWEEKWDERTDENYELALAKVKTKLRIFLVDWNYELFHTDDRLLKPRVYAMMANGLAEFHERAK
jgi:hypothetical protein